MRTVLVHTLKPCQLHRYNPQFEEEALGEYDGKTQPHMGGSWAYMCYECLELFGYPESSMLTFKLEVKQHDRDSKV